MNKFMKHQKLQFNSGSFRLAGLLRVVFLMCCLLSALIGQCLKLMLLISLRCLTVESVTSRHL